MLALFAAAALASVTITAIAVSPVKVDAVFKDFGRTTPGCAVGVYHKGKVLYAKGYGMADLTLGVPITPATNPIVLFASPPIPRIPLDKAS